MEITRITLENFLSIKEKQTIEFDKFSTIVGPNDSGKTNLFRAITIVGEVLDRQNSIPKSYYYKGDYEKTFRVEIDVKFSPTEKETIYNYLICSCYNRDPSRKSNESQELAQKLNFEIIRTNGKKFFQDFIDSITIVLIGTGQEYYRVEPQFQIKKNNEIIHIIDSGHMSLYETRRDYNANYSLGGLLFDEYRSKHESLVSKILIQRNNSSIPSTKMRIDDVFSYVLNKLKQKDPAQVYFDTVQLQEFERRGTVTPVEAKRLRKFLLENNMEDHGLSFEKLISLIYNNSIIKTSNIRTQPNASLNDRNSLNLVERLKDFSGKDLALILFDLKNSNDYKYREMFKDISNAFKGIFDDTTFDVGIISRRHEETKRERVGIPLRNVTRTDDYNDPNTILSGTQNITREILNHELFIQITRDGLTTSLDNSAAGIFDALYVLTCILGQKHKCILLDEPALNLHPNMQKKILNHISKTVRDNKNQVILVTHSPYLVSSENFENTWRVIRKSGATKIINIKKSLFDMPEKEGKKLLIRLSNSDVRSLLFSKGVVLVEGPSDKLVIERLDQKLALTDSGPKLDENEWTVLDIGGKEHLPSFLTLVNMLQIFYVGIVDDDAMMTCNNHVPTNDKSIKTSVIPYAIFKSKGFTDEEIKKMKKMSKTIKQRIVNGKNISTYGISQRRNMIDFCEKHDVIAFKKDLEYVLKSQIGRRESKPLKALENILYRLDNNRIPKELLDIMSFVKSRIKN